MKQTVKVELTTTKGSSTVPETLELWTIELQHTSPPDMQILIGEHCECIPDRKGEKYLCLTTNQPRHIYQVITKTIIFAAATDGFHGKYHQSHRYHYYDGSYHLHILFAVAIVRSYRELTLFKAEWAEDAERYQILVRRIMRTLNLGTISKTIWKRNKLLDFDRNLCGTSTH